MSAATASPTSTTVSPIALPVPVSVSFADNVKGSPAAGVGEADTVTALREVAVLPAACATIGTLTSDTVATVVTAISDMTLRSDDVAVEVCDLRFMVFLLDEGISSWLFDN